ncbi:succinate dehydrogenase cytochrome b560 subunit, mitochondrial [Drosophila miranda]|uniref:Succinate dehydrogenase cytochrome b560 subunit, mitochondrial n=2 Tax=pseudoobscura subgroup TaxID=32358 RepID=A0A6I8V6B9_DROPS|nr:succinate dehydrogenase cytochrome b560 subunit, mitochondrial [Drosophila persimilis]XP_003736918.1 succinate dehydrogenase cytochrome b560 subunit, mitochondrial [Drosophila pseudoobscura]XP_017143937.1 succinate dehydrogenase cytochrome b560 subunit, mitochondrial [Drosophila miranda]
MYALSSTLIRSPALRQGLKMAAVNRQASMKVVSVGSTIKDETYFEKNARLGRELSPHLSIYQPQLTSILSVMHRGTGMALGVGVWALGLGALISSHDISHYVTMVEGLQLSGATLTALKFIIAYPAGYHTANGIRHLFWDTGRFLKIKEVYSTGYAMVAASFVLTAILALI